MSWEEGNQPKLIKEDIHEELSKIEGFISEEEAAYQLTRFLRED